MTLPRSAADVLASHVLFEIEAIDCMYLNLYQPRLQHGAGIAAFFVGHRGNRFSPTGTRPSPAPSGCSLHTGNRTQTSRSAPPTPEGH